MSHSWTMTPKYDDTLSSIPSTEPTSYVVKCDTPEGTTTVEFSGARAQELANEFVNRESLRARQ